MSTDFYILCGNDLWGFRFDLFVFVILTAVLLASSICLIHFSFGSVFFSRIITSQRFLPGTLQKDLLMSPIAILAVRV